MPKKDKPKVRQPIGKICTSCNPKKFLKFNFSFLKEYGKSKQEDVIQLFERFQLLSSDMYSVMIYKYQGNKKSFIEDIPVNKLDIKKEIPKDFRDIYPAETNEKYSIFRVYPSGKPSGTANPRVIGMIKNTIFYIFYIDWDGSLYKHGR